VSSKIDPARKRKAVIRCYLTTTEKQAVAALARSVGLSESDLARVLLTRIEAKTLQDLLERAPARKSSDDRAPFGGRSFRSRANLAKVRSRFDVRPLLVCFQRGFP
jgi:hypothetical protein